MMCEGKNISKEISYFLIIIIVSLFSTNCYGSIEILNVRHWTAPDHTRIVLDVDGEPDYVVKESKNLLILNFKEASFPKSIPAKIIINKPGIKKIVFHHIDEDTVKIEFVLDKYQKIEVFKLKKFQDKPERVVVDIILEQEVFKEEKTPDKISKLKKKKIIVVDPGHGGEDPGAVGKKKTYEKNIVLSISREIKKTINRMPGYRAELTREGDYYVSFRKRLQKAKNLGASLFISVHADAARIRSAKGSSVYCLSTEAASNEAAKLLARNENLSDILGGVPDSEGNNESNQIIMNMFQTDTINLSKIYAGILIKHLDMVNYLKYKSVQGAPFRVLKLPDIPAVLIETAYISNPQEESLLKKNNFQKTLAASIASSIGEYLSDKTTVPQSNEETGTIYYKVKRGDTLFSVAGRFNTKVAMLLKLNNFKLEDQLFVGQKIMVPANITGNEENTNVSKPNRENKSNDRKKPLKFYTVKKGDTLFLLAKNNSTTVDELLKVNNMKITDPLLYGQKIKLP
ncbi:MAG: N-acetylmuramoyl-L-alanine amidase [Deltaproteobacteria bacterium]|nr:N-acetylmuramoyl-L-alanine amidase [Deltaproteobacteria bacterium]